MANDDFNAIMALTTQAWIEEVEPAIFDGNVLSWQINMMGMKEYHPGGDTFVVPLDTDKNENIKSYTGYDTFTITNSDRQSAAEFQWREFGGPTSYTTTDITKNNASSPETMIPFIDTILRNTKMSMDNQLEGMLLADSTGARDFNGIGTLIGTQNNEVGGITGSTTESYWQPRNIPVGAATITLSSVMNGINLCSKGSTMRPTLLLTRQQHYNAIENLLETNARYQNTLMAEAGWTHIGVNGVPLVFPDEDIAASTDVAMDEDKLFIINSRNLRLFCHTTEWMKMEQWERATNQAAWYSFIHCSGNLVCNRRDTMGVVETT